MIGSKVADMNNVSGSPHAGAITAAIYLQEFVDPGVPWAHLDVMAWNPQSHPGRPEGAEATALRSCAPHPLGPHHRAVRLTLGCVSANRISHDPRLSRCAGGCRGSLDTRGMALGSSGACVWQRLDA